LSISAIGLPLAKGGHCGTVVDIGFFSLFRPSLVVRPRPVALVRPTPVPSVEIPADSVELGIARRGCFVSHSVRAAGLGGNGTGIMSLANELYGKRLGRQDFLPTTAGKSSIDLGQFVGVARGIS